MIEEERINMESEGVESFYGSLIIKEQKLDNYGCKTWLSKKHFK